MSLSVHSPFWVILRDDVRVENIRLCIINHIVILQSTESYSKCYSKWSNPTFSVMLCGWIGKWYFQFLCMLKGSKIVWLMYNRIFFNALGSWHHQLKLLKAVKYFYYKYNCYIEYYIIKYILYIYIIYILYWLLRIIWISGRLNWLYW